MKIQENIDLSKYSTMRVGKTAKYFAVVESENDLIEAIEFANKNNLETQVIGEGSNLFFAKDFEGLVIRIKIKGIKTVKEDERNVYIQLGAGENWHKFVTYAVDNNLAGIENMALIPGTVGAAAVQNIAAYGQNQTDTFHELTALNIKTLDTKIFTKEDMDFQYRTSTFKQGEQNDFIVISVTYKLNKEFKLEDSYHERKARYGSLQDELEKVGKAPFSVKDAYNAVISIRTRKLPSIEEWGTVGSFFTNPLVTKEKFQELSKMIDELQSYPAEGLNYTIKNWNEVKDDYVKIPAGRLLDELGWKDKWINNVSAYKNHALCVVTREGATSEDVMNYIELMKKSVMDAYGVELESEVIIVK